MIGAEWEELIDLYLDNALPESLRARVETHLAQHQTASQDAISLRKAITELHTLPSPPLPPSFTERVLDRLLRDHADALPNDLYLNHHTHI